MKSAYDKMAVSLQQALDYAKGNDVDVIIHEIEVVDVKAIRKELGMTQNQFADTFRVSAGTVRNWEQKRRVPEGPAKTLMYIISKEPEAVKRALTAG